MRQGDFPPPVTAGEGASHPSASLHFGLPPPPPPLSLLSALNPPASSEHTAFVAPPASAATFSPALAPAVPPASLASFPSAGAHPRAPAARAARPSAEVGAGRGDGGAFVGEKLSRLHALRARLQRSASSGASVGSALAAAASTPGTPPLGAAPSALVAPPPSEGLHVPSLPLTASGAEEAAALTASAFAADGGPSSRVSPPRDVFVEPQGGGLVGGAPEAASAAPLHRGMSGGGGLGAGSPPRLLAAGVAGGPQPKRDGRLKPPPSLVASQKKAAPTEATATHALGRGLGAKAAPVVPPPAIATWGSAAPAARAEKFAGGEVPSKTPPTTGPRSVSPPTVRGPLAGAAAPDAASAPLPAPTAPAGPGAPVSAGRVAAGVELRRQILLSPQRAAGVPAPKAGAEPKVEAGETARGAGGSLPLSAKKAEVSAGGTAKKAGGGLPGAGAQLAKGGRGALNAQPLLKQGPSGSLKAEPAGAAAPPPAGQQVASTSSGSGAGDNGGGSEKDFDAPMSFEELMRRKREAQMAERMKQQQTLTAAASSRVSHPGPGVSAAASAAEGLARAARQPQVAAGSVPTSDRGGRPGESAAGKFSPKVPPSLVSSKPPSRSASPLALEGAPLAQGGAAAVDAQRGAERPPDADAQTASGHAARPLAPRGAADAVASVSAPLLSAGSPAAPSVERSAGGGGGGVAGAAPSSASWGVGGVSLTVRAAGVAQPLQREEGLGGHAAGPQAVGAPHVPQKAPSPSRRAPPQAGLAAGGLRTAAPQTAAEAGQQPPHLAKAKQPASAPGPSAVGAKNPGRPPALAPLGKAAAAPPLPPAASSSSATPLPKSSAVAARLSAGGAAQRAPQPGGGGKAAPPPPVPAQAQLSAAASSSAAAVAQPRGLAKPASAAGAAKRPPAGQPSVQPAAGASLSVQAKSGSVARGGAQAKATAASGLAGKAGQKVGVSPAARAQAAEGSPAQAVASKKATALAKPSGVAAASTAPGAAAAPAGASDAGDAKAISCALKNGDLGAYCRQLAAEVAAFHPLGSDAWPASLATASLGAEAFASLAEKLDVMSAHSDREMRERLLDIERTVAAVSTASSSAAAASSASGGAGAGAEGLCVRGVLEEILGPFLACALECAAPLDAAAARDAVIPFASMTFDELRDGVGAALGRTLTDVLGAPAEAAKGLGDPRQLSQALARLALWSDAMETRISSWANEFSKSTGKRPFAHPAAGAQGATAQLPKKLKATTSSVPAISE